MDRFVSRLLFPILNYAFFTLFSLHPDMLRGIGTVPPEGLKMAAMIITILPIVVIYPYCAKYFIHGQFVDTVKG